MPKNAFELFMERTDERLEHIQSRVDKLWEFRAMMIGGSIVVSVICSSVVAVAAIYFGAH